MGIPICFPHVVQSIISELESEGALPGHFQKYYDAVMPYLKAILMNATDKANCMLRAKSMECISLVGMAVGKDKFKDDVKHAWARLYKCLGQDFLPYMNVVMPPLLHFIQLKPDVTITSADDSDDDIDDIETITLGDKIIGIKTSVLHEKATTCNMLCCYADELKEVFSYGLIRGSNVKADDQSQKSPEGAWRVPKVLRPLYESPTILAQKTMMISKLPDNNKALDGLTKSKEAALLDAERTVYVALVKASMVDNVQNKNQELMKLI
ncbi:unnamed protein product [Lactuca saligna]|uniref:Uncharacterized protein n=1 Tax=Lactuca saligna TaxID=75948 RepID=A0AA36EQZ2_LACSI|nr:unnamed protein product [Lactuca saligna]